MKRKVLSALLIAAMTVATVGCGGGSQPTADADASAETEAPAEDAAADDAEAPAEDAAADGTADAASGDLITV